MDTNQIVEIVRLLAAGQKSIVAQNGGHTTMIIVGQILAAIMPTLAALGALIYAKAAAVATAKNERVTEMQAESLDKVHDAVNSERTATLATVSSQRDEIRKLSELVATLLENQKSVQVPIKPADASLLQAVQELTRELASRKSDK